MNQGIKNYQNSLIIFLYKRKCQLDKKTNKIKKEMKNE